MSKKIRLLIPHTSQRGNFYPRGIYDESQLPSEILRSRSIEVGFEESNTIDLKENVVIIKRETRLEAENKGLVEKPLEERIEKAVVDKIEERSPKIEKVNHNPKEELPPAIKTEYEAILDKDLDREVTVKENKTSKKITRIL